MDTPDARVEVETTEPWSLRPAPLGSRAVLAVGAGSIIASFYIGTGDISIATSMGAQFGMRLWWTYLVLGIAAWALIDMSTRYFVRFGKTPMSMFKDVHPVFAVFMAVTVIVCALFGSYSQWNACAMVLTGFMPRLPIEAGGMLAALVALAFLLTGAYARVERVFVFGLIALIVCVFGAALMAGFDWREALRGLVPNAPEGPWRPLFAANAGSLINAWLILIYPYTLIERKLYSSRLQGKVNILHRARLDYGWGILAAAVVALPLMAAANAVARPFGILPRNYTDLGMLLEPLAGPASTALFLLGLFLAAWTSGVGWWLGGSYALMDIFNLPIKLDSKPMRICLVLFFVPSTLLLLLRINPVYQIIVFAAFLAVVAPLIGLVMLYRVTRPDMGYFRWSAANYKGLLILLVDVYAIVLCIYVGWRQFSELFVQK